ncbi:hypothetical protein ACFLWA_06470 [Chloroflexota bacterium]
MTKKRSARSLLVGGFVLVMAGLYCYGAVRQLVHVNTEMHSIDQHAYMTYASSMKESGYTFIGGRNRMPVYPFLQSLFYRPGLTEDQFFVHGKYINLILSLGLLAGLALIFSHFFRWLHTLNLMLIVAFTVFVFKAGWLQTELLFYFVNFCLFLLMWQMLRQPSYPLAIATGLVAGLAHLTKASILPGLVLFLLAAGVQALLAALRERRSAEHIVFSSSALCSFLVVPLVGVVFLVTVFPYISTSKRVFGQYFYNVNSTFYIWYDSWDEAKEGTRAHGDRVGWPDMPPEQIPRLSKYLRDHTGKQIASRFVDGARRIWNNVVHSYGYFKYIAIYSSFLVVVAVCFWRRTLRGLAARPILYLFLLGYFASYLILYAWYAAIADGNRLVLAQFIPFMFVVSWGLTRLLQSARVRLGEHRTGVLVLFNLAVVVVISVDIYAVLVGRVGTMFGGS